METPDGIGRLEWRGESNKTLDEVEAERETTKRDPELENQAKEFLKAELARGPVLVDDLKSVAERKSFSWSTVERAKRSLKITSRGGYRGKKAEWHLSDDHE